MRRLRLLTAGESHGPAISGIVDGLPAGVPVSSEEVNRDLRRRQHGYGSGRRMQIEHDEVTWLGGLRFGRTLGSPLAFRVDNRDWQNWSDRMATDALPARPARRITLARPGHADLAGAVKYDTDDVRNVLERASARSTVARVAAGAVCRQLLVAAGGIRIWSFVERLGVTRAFPDADDPVVAVPEGWPDADLAAPSPLRCPDPVAEMRMVAEVDAVAEAGDSVGGSFVVVAENVPVGMGSSAEWDTRLDAALAAAIMGIPAVKAVGIGAGFDVAMRRGSEVHDEVAADALDWRRVSNRAGGIEGGMSNGMPIVVRASVKPVSTLRHPLSSVDVVSGEPGRAHIERSDVAIIPRAAVVGEAMVALVLVDALLTSFGGDTLADLSVAVRRRRDRSGRPSPEALTTADPSRPPDDD